MKTLKSTLKVLDTSIARSLKSSPTTRVRGRKLMERNARLAWQKPLCVICEKAGIPTAATQWDHIVPLKDGGADHESNLQGLCDKHHEKKTLDENKARWSA